MSSYRGLVRYILFICPFCGRGYFIGAVGGWVPEIVFKCGNCGAKRTVDRHEYERIEGDKEKLKFIVSGLRKEIKPRDYFKPTGKGEGYR